MQISKYTKYIDIIKEIADNTTITDRKLLKILFKNSKGNSSTASKSVVLEEYKKLKRSGKLVLTKIQEQNFLNNIKRKEVRTVSGVTPVTVLTKPFACPGQCIFCPNDVKMPKSYLSSEPGAQRAYDNKFDPYYQTFNRLVAFNKIGHPTGKVEIIVLGGTWNSYPKEYQRWFVKRCFEALNDFDPSLNPDALKPLVDMPFDEAKIIDASGSYNKIVGLALDKIVAQKETCTWDGLEEVHEKNVNALSRCTGLVIETRPDEINEETVVELRRLGATKVQLGVQSLNDNVLKMNKRGHDSAQTALAFKLLRDAGFKIQIHWMPNLYGATPEADIKDFDTLFDDWRFIPDELKVYPCSLIEGTELMSYYNSGSWKPYTREELLKVLKNILAKVPRFSRVTRMIRDISSDDIFAGNKTTNFRQIVEKQLAEENIKINEIRSREIKDNKVNRSDLELRKTFYETATTKECFLEYTTPKDLIAGFLRLSFPKQPRFIDEVKDSAMIREIHIYGESIEVGEKSVGEAQHLGLGKALIKEAAKMAREAGFKDLAVISAVGTRGYYAKNGFIEGTLFQHM